jgi:hypothetical protein
MMAHLKQACQIYYSKHIDNHEASMYSWLATKSPVSALTETGLESITAEAAIDPQTHYPASRL